MWWLWVVVALAEHRHDAYTSATDAALMLHHHHTKDTDAAAHAGSNATGLAPHHHHAADAPVSASLLPVPLLNASGGEASNTSSTTERDPDAYEDFLQVTDSSVFN
jgi:hypothetical protein